MLYPRVNVWPSILAPAPGESRLETVRASSILVAKWPSRDQKLTLRVVTPRMEGDTGTDFYSMVPFPCDVIDCTRDGLPQEIEIGQAFLHPLLENWVTELQINDNPSFNFTRRDHFPVQILPLECDVVLARGVYVAVGTFVAWTAGNVYVNTLLTASQAFTLELVGLDTTAGGNLFHSALTAVLAAPAGRLGNWSKVNAAASTHLGHVIAGLTYTLYAMSAEAINPTASFEIAIQQHSSAGI